eukprot:scaffold1456_cov392-Prasinococcus_capsulatus_cf.AAC.4
MRAASDPSRGSRQHKGHGLNGHALVTAAYLEGIIGERDAFRRQTMPVLRVLHADLQAFTAQAEPRTPAVLVSSGAKVLQRWGILREGMASHCGKSVLSRRGVNSEPCEAPKETVAGKQPHC